MVEVDEFSKRKPVDDIAKRTGDKWREHTAKLRDSMNVTADYKPWTSKKHIFCTHMPQSPPPFPFQQSS